MIEFLASLAWIVRTVVALVLAGFLPGYALIHWIFAQAAFDRLERLYLSVLSSFCITSLIAYGLSRTSTGITPQGLFVWLAGFALLCSLGAMISQGEITNRLHRVSLAARDGIEIWKPSVRLNWAPDPLASVKTQWPLLKMGGIVLLGLAVLAFGAEVRSQALALTEFYVSPRLLDVERIHYRLIPGGIEIPVEVVNREGHPVSYQIQIWTADRRLGSTYRNRLDNGQTWSTEVSVLIPDVNNVGYIDLYLFEEEEVLFKRAGKTPLAELRIWVAPNREGEVG